MRSDRRHPKDGPPRDAGSGPVKIGRTEVTTAQFPGFAVATGCVTVAERGVGPAGHAHLPRRLPYPGSRDVAPQHPVPSCWGEEDPLLDLDKGERREERRPLARLSPRNDCGPSSYQNRHDDVARLVMGWAGGGFANI